ncbi:MAG: STING domain-containing protein [Variovorax sp.]
MTKQRAASDITARQGWDAFRALVAEYNWPTKLATSLLILSASISIGKEFPCIFGTGCLPKNWLDALSSDGMLTMLSLTVAFCIGIHIKLRQEQGLVDGAEHYSVGRALAYGYFSNFIIGVLLTLRAEGKRLGPQAGRPVMHIVFPQNVQDLDGFRESVERNVKLHTKSHDIINVGNVDKKLFKRSLLALTQLGTADGTSDTFYLDFPTTLYTMQDFLETWNIWLEDHGRPLLPAEELKRLQQKYIADFFAHLEDLASSPVGADAARRLGANLTSEELAALYKTHIAIVEPDAILAIIEADAKGWPPQ